MLDYLLEYVCEAHPWIVHIGADAYYSWNFLFTSPVTADEI